MQSFDDSFQMLRVLIGQNLSSLGEGVIWIDGHEFSPYRFGFFEPPLATEGRG
jgi:hypothetical protein